MTKTKQNFTKKIKNAPLATHHLPNPAVVMYLE